MHTIGDGGSTGPQCWLGTRKRWLVAVLALLHCLPGAVPSDAGVIACGNQDGWICVDGTQSVEGGREGREAGKATGLADNHAAHSHHTGVP